jgi:hypothetical protein
VPRRYSGPTDLTNRRITAWRGKNLRIDLEMDRRGIEKIAVSNPLRHSVLQVIRERALPYAKAISPYDPKGKAPHYRDSFHIRPSYAVIAGMRRVAGQLWNLSDHSVEVEWINDDRVLTKTLGFLQRDSVVAELLRSHEARAKFKAAGRTRDSRGRFLPKRSPDAERSGSAETADRVRADQPENVTDYNRRRQASDPEYRERMDRWRRRDRGNGG